MDNEHNFKMGDREKSLGKNSGYYNASHFLPHLVKPRNALTILKGERNYPHLESLWTCGPFKNCPNRARILKLLSNISTSNDVQQNPNMIKIFEPDSKIEENMNKNIVQLNNVAESNKRGENGSINFENVEKSDMEIFNLIEIQNVKSIKNSVKKVQEKKRRFIYPSDYVQHFLEDHNSISKDLDLDDFSDLKEIVEDIAEIERYPWEMECVFRLTRDRDIIICNEQIEDPNKQFICPPNYQVDLPGYSIWKFEYCDKLLNRNKWDLFKYLHAMCKRKPITMNYEKIVENIIRMTSTLATFKTILNDLCDVYRTVHGFKRCMVLNSKEM